jgi:hypothetical protein
MKDRQNVWISLLVLALVLAWFVLTIFDTSRVVQAEKVPQTPAEEWLSWSPEARMRYVHGYLDGFERGKRVACYWHDEKEASSTSAPILERVCMKSLPEFTEPYQHVYVDAITNYFTKYSHDRQAGPSRILDELASPPGLTVDQIHAKLAR